MGATIELGPEPGSVRAARRFTTDRLVEWGASDRLVETAALLVSELTSNVILHARTPFVLSLHQGRRVRVEVEDGDVRPPVGRVNDLEAASGRGLLLIEAMSSAHGAETGEHGKRVWFELAWDRP